MVYKLPFVVVTSTLLTFRSAEDYYKNDYPDEDDWEESDGSGASCSEI
jgi:hypothetical protein